MGVHTNHLLGIMTFTLKPLYLRFLISLEHIICLGQLCYAECEHVEVNTRKPEAVFAYWSDRDGTGWDGMGEMEMGWGVLA